MKVPATIALFGLGVLTLGVVVDVPNDIICYGAMYLKSDMEQAIETGGTCAHNKDCVGTGTSSGYQYTKTYPITEDFQTAFTTVRAAACAGTAALSAQPINPVPPPGWTGGSIPAVNMVYATETSAPETTVYCGAVYSVPNKGGFTKC